MTSFFWMSPGCLWIGLLPPVLLLAWGASEWRRRKRLRGFGDPKLLGLSTRWGPRLTSVLLVLLGVSGAAAIVPLPARRGERKEAKVLSDVILLDMASLRSLEERLPDRDIVWDRIEDTVRGIVDAGAGARYALYRSGLPFEMLVPPTADAQALFMLLTRYRLNRQESETVGLEACLKAMDREGENQEGINRLLVITALPVEEIQHLPGNPGLTSRGVSYVLLPGAEGVPRYGSRGEGGAWSWTVQPPAGYSPESAEEPEHWLRRWTVTQGLALLAFLFLAAESLFTLFVPLSRERMAP